MSLMLHPRGRRADGRNLDWDQKDRKQNRWCLRSGYEATCNKCGAKLEASLTKDDVKARLFFWSVREQRTERRDEKSECKAVLDPLLRNHEKRTEVTKSLALDFIDFSAGSVRRSELRKWLFLHEVADAEAKYPGILFHMSPLTMTWLFFDGEERLQDYFVRPA